MELEARHALYMIQLISTHTAEIHTLKIQDSRPSYFLIKSGNPPPLL